MANTMAELATLSTDTLKKGIMETIVYESPWLRELPFIDISGNSYLYNWETALAGATFYMPNEKWTEVPPTWEQRSTNLVILGGDADVDKFMQQTRRDQDLKAGVIEKKTKAIAYAFDEFAVLGRTTALGRYTSVKAFKGMIQQVAECESTTAVDLDGINNSQVVPGTTTAGVLTLDYIDQLIDKVKPRATHIVMNRRMIRKVKSLARAAGNNLQVGTGALGLPFTMYGEQKILIDDWSPDNWPDAVASVLSVANYDNTAYDGTHDCSVILALNLSEDGVCGLRNGDITTEELGTVQDANATRTRIVFYCGLAQFSKLAAAALIGVNYSG
jgi:hypothetical protein